MKKEIFCDTFEIEKSKNAVPHNKMQIEWDIDFPNRIEIVLGCRFNQQIRTIVELKSLLSTIEEVTDK